MRLRRLFFAAALAAVSGGASFGCSTVLGITIDIDNNSDKSGGTGGASSTTSSQSGQAASGSGTGGAGGGGGGGGLPQICIPASIKSCYTGAPGTENVGACKSGVTTCSADGLSWGPCVGETDPTAETCDGIDNDCNAT